MGLSGEKSDRRRRFRAREKGVGRGEGTSALTGGRPEVSQTAAVVVLDFRARYSPVIII